MKSKTVSVCATGVPGTPLVTMSAAVDNQVVLKDWLLDAHVLSIAPNEYPGTYVLRRHDVLRTLAVRFGIENVDVVSMDACSMCFAIVLGSSESDDLWFVPKIADDACDD